MIYLLNSLNGLSGAAIVALTFLIILSIFKIFGGDKGQEKRSEWFPLWYILPIMAAMILFFILTTR